MTFWGNVVFHTGFTVVSHGYIDTDGECTFNGVRVGRGRYVMGKDGTLYRGDVDNGGWSEWDVKQQTWVDCPEAPEIDHDGDINVNDWTVEKEANVHVNMPLVLHKEPVMGPGATITRIEHEVELF